MRFSCFFRKISIMFLVLTTSTSCQSISNFVFSCEQQPTSEKVNQILQKHKNTVKQLENISPGHVTVEPIELKKCPGKYKISITHATDKEGEKIKEIIGNTFFGIPYELFNI